MLPPDNPSPDCKLNVAATPETVVPVCITTFPVLWLLFEPMFKDPVDATSGAADEVPDINLMVPPFELMEEPAWIFNFPP